MVTQEVTINNEVGLHARPATFFIQKANEFKSGIWVEKDERRVNAKSLLGVLSLGITKGTTITLLADGSDEKEAVKLEPSNIRALELGGIVAYQSGQYAKAAEFWQELLLLTPQDSPAYSRLLDAISDAKNRAQMNFKF